MMTGSRMQTISTRFHTTDQAPAPMSHGSPGLKGVSPRHQARSTLICSNAPPSATVVAWAAEITDGPIGNRVVLLNEKLDDTGRRRDADAMSPATMPRRSSVVELRTGIGRVGRTDGPAGLRRGARWRRCEYHRHVEPHVAQGAGWPPRYRPCPATRRRSACSTGCEAMSPDSTLSRTDSEVSSSKFASCRALPSTRSTFQPGRASCRAGLTTCP